MRSGVGGRRRLYRLTDVSRDRVIAASVERADSLSKRCRGLLGRRRLEQGAGIWLPGTNGVHTFGMGFPIDILVLDADGRAVRALSAVRPWRVVLPAPHGRDTLELPAGALDGTAIGHRFVLDPL